MNASAAAAAKARGGVPAYRSVEPHSSGKPCRNGVQLSEFQATGLSEMLVKTAIDGSQAIEK
jgi:hypothetical protein